MLFAAGLGTRLKPLTDTMPKALVRVGGKPLLDHVLDKLEASGFERVVINVHHFADQIEDYLAAHPRQHIDIRLSDERACLLDTGGGLRKAIPLFDPHSQLLIHNVDILSNVCLEHLLEQAEGTDATLLVSERQTSRYLLFDNRLRLMGWTHTGTGEVRTPYPSLDLARCRRLAFAGIHVISPQLLQQMQSWPERFGIVDFYLKHCMEARIQGYLKTDLKLMDVGKAETLADAELFARRLSASDQS